MAGREFFELVKAIGESKSKQEEDRIITEEVIFLKKTIGTQKEITKKKMKELIIRGLYVEMLGQDAAFLYIKIVELCASTNIIQKRTGYLSAAQCFSPGHEFRFMLVNQIQRDMNSSNQLEVTAALSAVCKIVTEDMIPAVVGDVVKLLKHEMEQIRKKAVCALHRLYQMDKSSLADHFEKIRLMICDRDPSVMGASLPLLYDMIKENPSDFKDIVPSLVSIIKQVVEHRLPKEFDYHRIPAPWVQMQLLKILAILGRGDQASSEGMYEVLVDVMRRADTGINVGYAIVYEAVTTVITIYPNPLLLEAAATAISRFIRSDSNNLKYIGVKGLAAIVKDYPKYAADHQMAVIDCLEDPDETLKRKTLDLVFRMTNSVNVEYIVEKLLSFLSTATDDHFRADLVGQITQCAERFAPSHAWYVRTMVRLFELAGDKVKMSVAQTLMQLIAEGADDDNDDDNDDENTGSGRDEILRREAVENFLELLEKPIISDILSQTMVWILGEYGYLSTSHTKEKIMEKLCHLGGEVTDNITRGQIVTALMKLVAQAGACPQFVQQFLSLYRDSRSAEVQERCYEFEALLANSHMMADVLPVDASCEDINVDEKLGFLQEYVNKALANGALPYNPPRDAEAYETVKEKTTVLKTGAYEKPHIPTAPVSGVLSSAVSTAATTATDQSAAGKIAAPGTKPLNNPATTQGNQLLNFRSTQQVWGKKVEPAVTSPDPSTDTNANTTTTPTSNTSSISAPVAPVSKPTPTLTTPAVPQLSEQALKEKAQKEKMAAGLFGGISANSKPVTIKPKAGVNAPAATPMKQSLSKGSLIDTDSPLISMTLSQPAIQASKPATGGGLFDSMEVRAPTVPYSSGGGLMTWGSPAPAPVTSPTPAPSIFASTVMHTPPLVPQTAPSPMSLFDGMIASPVIAPAPVIAPVVTPTMSASNNHGGLLDMESSVMRPMSVSVDSFDSSSTPHMNAPMQAPVHTVPTPILTQSPVMIPQSSVGGGGSGGGGGLATISMGMNPIFIKPNTVTDAFADMNKLSLEPTVSLPQPNISISSISTATSGPATGGIRLSPLQITTQEFGQKWGQLAAEVKGSCSSNISILAELSTVFPSIYHNVESIHATNESIFAASGNVGSIVVLVHLKVHAAKKSIDITVKSTTRQICADLLKSIISALSSSSS